MSYLSGLLVYLAISVAFTIGFTLWAMFRVGAAADLKGAAPHE